MHSIACHNYAKGMTSVHQFVCNEGWIMITQCSTKWKWANDRIACCHGNLHAAANQITVIPVITNSRWRYRKCEVLRFGSNNLWNGASYVLDQYRSLIGSRIWRIEWHYLQKTTTTGSAVQNTSNYGCNVVRLLWHQAILLIYILIIEKLTVNVYASHVTLSQFSWKMNQRLLNCRNVYNRLMSMIFVWHVCPYVCL